jgi:hypothetical protein
VGRGLAGARRVDVRPAGPRRLAGGVAVLAKQRRDELELGVEKKMRRLYELVDGVAAKRKLPEPDEIRLSAGTVAHVYENHKGKLILVLGGLSVAAFTQQALAGVVRTNWVTSAPRHAAASPRPRVQRLHGHAGGLRAEYRLAYLNP